MWNPLLYIYADLKNLVSGMIQALRQKWGLTGEVNVFSLTIQDAF